MLPWKQELLAVRRYLGCAESGSQGDGLAFVLSCFNFIFYGNVVDLD